VDVRHGFSADAAANLRLARRVGRSAGRGRLALGDLAPLGRSPSSAPTPLGAQGIAPGGDPIAAVLALDLPLIETRQRVVDEVERRYVARVLAANNGNVTRAAAAAGIARRYFYRLKAKASGQSE
jgi:transcriptional regulator of acetoin/glycerol metabolism